MTKSDPHFSRLWDRHPGTRFFGGCQNAHLSNVHHHFYPKTRSLTDGHTLQKERKQAVADGSDV